MGLKPLHDSFIFQFLNETADGRFIERSRSGIILTNLNMEAQSKYARWGRVNAIGPDVIDFELGDLVLIEQGQWTSGIKYDEQMYWRSTQEKVLAVSNDESVAFTA